MHHFLHHKNGYGVVLDVTKAFDTVSHEWLQFVLISKFSSLWRNILSSMQFGSAYIYGSSLKFPISLGTK